MPITARQFLARFRLLILIQWLLPPAVGVNLMSLMGIWRVEDAYFSLIRYTGVYVVIYSSATVWYLNRFMKPLAMAVEQDSSALSREEVSRQLMGFTPRLWGLFLVYTGLGTLTVNFSLIHFRNQTYTIHNHLYSEVGAVPSILIVALPFFFLITDLFGRYFAPRGVLPPLAPVGVKVASLGLFTPILIETVLIFYYHDQTGLLSVEVMSLWLGMLGVAGLGAWLAVRSFRQALAPLHFFRNSGQTPGPQSLDEIGHLIAGLADARRGNEDSRARFDRAIRGSNDGLWEWDMVTGHNYFSPRWGELLGYGEKELNPHVDTYLRLVHPDDQARMWDGVNAHLEEGRVYDLEIRLRTKDGSYRWFRDRGAAERDVSGRPVRMSGSITDITEQKTAEAEVLRLNAELEARVEYRTAELEAERNFITTVLQSQDALVVVMTPDSHIVRFNRACEHLTGYTESEVLGKSGIELFTLPEDRASVNQIKAKVAPQNFPFRHRRSWRTKDGGIRRIDWHNSALLNKDGGVAFVISTGLDVTEQEQKDIHLQASEERYRTLVETMKEGVGRIDAKGKIQFVNTALTLMLGYSKEEMVGMVVMNLFDTKNQKILAEQLKKRSSGEYAPYEIEMLRKDGSSIQTLASPIPLMEGGVLNGSIAVFMDLTELNRTRDSMLRNERLAALGKLTATVSHELRNPLGVIQNSVFFLENKFKVPGMEAPLDRIRRGSERAVNIIEELLEYARSSAPDRKPVEFQSWLGEIIGEFTFPVEVDLELNFQANGVRVALDEERFRRVLINIIENAVQSIQMRIEEEPDGEQHIAIHTQRNGSTLSLRVEDTGGGIKPEVAGKIFEPLFSTKSFGVGLGLSIVKKIVEDHQGRITLSNRPQGLGAVAEVILPLYGES
ncbi:MAG: PAS domain S-box protein [Deltaproteobacteria bacterium]|nr:PAS domain S-box protein [Deltaproteobacteria bacterium]